MTTDAELACNHYTLVAEAIRLLGERRREAPSLPALAGHLGCSPSHLQRVFSTWAGVSPQQYLHFLAKEEALRRLREGSVLDAALSSGLSGTGRLHDLVVKLEGMTPGEYRQGGNGLDIRFGVAPSPFGRCFVAGTGRGICKLAFFDDEGDVQRCERELRENWPSATVLRDDDAIAALVPSIFPDIAMTSPPRAPLRLLLRGSPFQIRVWEALLRIPEGGLRSYGQVAASIGQPSAVRAVASAIARNDIGYLIPCHRVIRDNGEFSRYRWGDIRKQAMIAREACHRDERA